MCNCDWNNVCLNHGGVWPYDPALPEQDDRELERERRERELGLPDFLGRWGETRG